MLLSPGPWQWSHPEGTPFSPFLCRSSQGAIDGGHFGMKITLSSLSFYHFSVCSSKQVAAAYFLCPWTRRQDLRLHTVPTEVFLPNRAAGNVPMGRTGIELGLSAFWKQGHFKSGFTVSLTLGHHDALYGLGQREN